MWIVVCERYESIAYLIWKGSYNDSKKKRCVGRSIAYLIWKGSYNLPLC